MRVIFQMVLAIFLVLGGIATAQSTKPDLRGIGLLVQAGKGGCTGTLVEPDLVLTAAHCLLGRRDSGEHYTPEEFLFHPTTASGLPGPGYRGQAVAVHPVYLLLNEGDPKKLRRDIGLIRLEEPVPDQFATPLPVSVPDLFPARGFLLSYQGYRDARQRQRSCPVIHEEDQILVIGCRVTGGESGSPLLIRQGGGMAVYAVVSSRFDIKSQPVGLAIVAGHGFAGMLAAMQDGQGR